MRNAYCFNIITRFKQCNLRPKKLDSKHTQLTKRYETRVLAGDIPKGRELVRRASQPSDSPSSGKGNH
jgi:hypothetical protein